VTVNSLPKRYSSQLRKGLPMSGVQAVSAHPDVGGSMSAAFWGPHRAAPCGPLRRCTSRMRRGAVPRNPPVRAKGGGRRRPSHRHGKRRRLCSHLRRLTQASKMLATDWKKFSTWRSISGVCVPEHRRQCRLIFSTRNAQAIRHPARRAFIGLCV
jgi:hypothetical protein